jgi:hypothetical protein
MENRFENDQAIERNNKISDFFFSGLLAAF